MTGRRPLGPVVPLPPLDPDLPRTYTEAIIALQQARLEIAGLRGALAFKTGQITDLSYLIDRFEAEEQTTGDPEKQPTRSKE